MCVIMYQQAAILVLSRKSKYLCINTGNCHIVDVNFLLQGILHYV